MTKNFDAARVQAAFDRNLIHRFNCGRSALASLGRNADPTKLFFAAVSVRPDNHFCEQAETLAEAVDAVMGRAEEFYTDAEDEEL